VGVFIGDVVDAARVQSITPRRAYGRKDAIDDATALCVRGDGCRGARGIEAGGICGGVGGGSRTLMEEDLGSVGGGVGGGNRTLMETFLARKMVDLIRARIESILASRI
jgi:hypothetical protein